MKDLISKLIIIVLNISLSLIDNIDLPLEVSKLSIDIWK